MDQKRFGRLLTAFLIGCYAPIFAGQSGEERFPSRVTIQTMALDLCSQAELKAFRFIHVGNAALYSGDCSKVSDIFSETPKWLRFFYDQPIPAKAFREASSEYLKINLGQKFEQWKSAFDRFNDNYRDVKAGDYYDLVYSPSVGLALQLNGRDLAVITDRDIALAYLNVWFGNEPFSDDLKNALLKLNN